MVREGRDFVDCGGVGEGGAGAVDILYILAAAGIGAEGRGDEGYGVADTVVTHLSQGIGQEGMPVAVSPVDGDFQDGSESGDELTVLVVDGAAAVEVVIVFGYFEHAVAGDVAAAEDVF